MLFEQVQRVILAKKIFWGEVHFQGVVVSFFYTCASVFWGNLKTNSVPRARDPLARVDEAGTRGQIGQKPKTNMAASGVV